MPRKQSSPRSKKSPPQHKGAVNNSAPKSRKSGKTVTATAHKTSPKKSSKTTRKPAAGVSKQLVTEPEVALVWWGWKVRLATLMRSPRFGIIFAWTSVAILTLTTLFWSILGARLQEGNADQFIDAYLFDSIATFSGALFPGAHTFLLKWPLFALMQIYGYHTFVFMVATVLMVLTTIGVLVYIMKKIEPRPLIFGMLCLALSLVLLLIPAQPYPGALLPSNFAMTTTRNLEYALFVGCLYHFMAARQSWNNTFWLLTGLMALVFASDKLFAVLLVGGALVMLVGYVGLLRRRYDLRRTLRLLALGALAFGLANIVLVAIDRLGVTNIVSGSSTSPYPLVHSLSQGALGLIYGVGAVLTNMGANPIHDVIIVRELPGALLHNLAKPTILVYMCNFIILLVGLFAIFKVVKSRTTDTATRLTVVLVSITVAALAVFVATDHYYPVDARYVAIELFAIFIALATYLRTRQLRSRSVAIVTAVLLLMLPLGMAQTWHEYRAGVTAGAGQNRLTTTIASILERHNITRLMGDYWQVTPVKARTTHNLVVAPTDDCQRPHPVLNSKAWFALPQSTPTALLLQRDGEDKTTFNGCSLAKVATLYGTPTQRVILSTSDKPPYRPQSLLLVYDEGTHPLTDQKPAAVGPPAPLTVLALSEKAKCSATSLNVAAHEDDDLLFMNPDVLGDIQAGRCIRTVYVTAGDAGASAAYWHSRQQGAQAAYADMYNVPNQWHQQREQLNGRFVTVAYLDTVPNVSLVFLHLPDGGTKGNGFASTSYESLRRLNNGAIAAVHSVDDGTAYSKEQLVSDLATLMTTDKPDIIRSQGSNNPTDGDHSDHHAVGALTALARQQYPDGPAVTLYIGYPDKVWPVNLTDDQITLKQRAFLVYAKYDGAVCQTAFDCQQQYTYGNYLIRQYRAEPADHAAPATP